MQIFSFTHSFIVHASEKCMVQALAIDPLHSPCVDYEYIKHITKVMVTKVMVTMVTYILQVSISSNYLTMADNVNRSNNGQ